MSLVLLLLIQAQEPRRLSKTVIVSSILVFLIGVSLLVYFFRRYKKTEKEAQDEWDRPGQSLFGGGAPAVDREESQSLTEAEALAASSSDRVEQERKSADKSEPTSIPPAFEPELPVLAESLTQGLKSEESPEILASAPELDVTQRPTEVLSSETELESATSNSLREPTTSKDDVPSALETAEQKVSVPAATQLLGVEQTPASRPLESSVDASDLSEAAELTKPPSQTELLGVARVESNAPREPFEPPRTPPIVHRQPWEPPTIEPLKARVQTPITQPETRETRTQILASLPPLTEGPSASHTGVMIDDEASPAEIEAPAAATASSVAGMRVPAGSILGIPAERSRAPLVLGTPAKGRDEIGALSNYGRDIEGGGGHGGTIALAVVILLLGAAIAAYMFVPAVNSRMNAMAARARGIDPNPPQAVEQPKARIFPARNEANKNIVKARGAVDNISEETLNNLSVEVSLEGANGAPPELRKVPVNPAQLAPKQRGVFEFQYDGNRATGFGGYRIVRLLSGEEEVKFTTPRQNG
jgi:flagellar basal body-associated protein FliL